MSPADSSRNKPTNFALRVETETFLAVAVVSAIWFPLFDPPLSVRARSFVVVVVVAEGIVTATIVLTGKGKNTYGTLMKTPQDVRDFFGTHYPCTFGPKGPSEEVAKDFLERR